MQNLELTIKELSDLFEISPRTIRYYEEKGLLESMRKDNNYRIYDINSVNRLETILSLKRSGLTLEKIHDLMNQPSNVKETLYAQKEALDKQMLVLKKSQLYIDQLLERLELVEKYGLQKIFIQEVPTPKRYFTEAWRKPKNGIYIDEDETIEIGIDPCTGEILGIYQKTSQKYLKKMATYFFYQNEKPISEYAMEFVKGIHDLHCECQNVIFLNSNESLCWMTCEVISL